MPSPLPYAVHSGQAECLPLSAEEQGKWWASTGLLFLRLLEMAGYDERSTETHLGVYAERVIPYLGTFPTKDGPRWHSILTRYGYPFELSLNCSNSVARYTFEPISAATGTVKDPFNTMSIWESLRLLSAIQPNIDLEWFTYFKKHLTLTTAESLDLFTGNKVTDQIKTQNKLALDLERDGSFTVKVYMYPQLKSLATSRSVKELMFSAVQAQTTNDSNLRCSFALLGEYIDSRTSKLDPAQTLEPRLFSCDLLRPADSRIKLYFLERNVGLAAMEELWTMGGRLTGPSIVDGLSLLRQLWTLLDVQPGHLDYPVPYLEHATMPSEQLPSMVNYTLSPRSPEPEPQIYFSVFGMKDLQLTAALAMFFRGQGWTEMAVKYEHMLQDLFPDCEPQTLNYIHAYISFSYRGQRPYVSVYLHSLRTNDWHVQDFER